MSELFKSLENASSGTRRPLMEIFDSIRWNEGGLIPAIAQQHDTGEVLMMAWMNRASLQETLDTGRVCYWSRSRGKLWRKGESSGQEQHLKQARLDCDGDTLLLSVDQTGPACHTGRRSCFYVALDAEQATVDSEPMISPSELYSGKR
ncbi:phosphoribosyl-AMP cyclohydrolase [Modicisalibacter xianhensis]|uniref:Phosphoribosyl-AMP cyclohydrolase n=1 Tax=Modicisalibacter xianhensis TaxID=442341 RepID=A0A1I3CDS8_9GAMM|nr:phosphoribosyl-AMP cyclohydrolase [Halomonas xianhensis]SFH72704.1 phosphoribosyl-AMP cyclohydrolase [Halomonas xianhensis]